MYEMFLGPIEQHKPWDTKGIDGVSRFVNKLWRLFFNEEGEFVISEEKANADENKILHKAIKKVNEDIESFSFNTAISAIMVCVNELGKKGTNKSQVLDPLVRLVAPFAPFISEELWALLGNKSSVVKTEFPVHEEKHIMESDFEYPISVNGKLRAKLKLPMDYSRDQVEEEVLALDKIKKWIGEGGPKKVIVVPKRIVNIVV